MLSIVEYKDRVEQLLEMLRQEITADAVTLHFYDEIANILYLPTSAGLRNREQFERGIPNMSRVPGQIARTRRPVFATDIAQAQGLAGPFSYREEVKSVAGLPAIDSADRLIGVVFLNYRETNAFPHQEQDRITNAVSRLSQRIDALRGEFGQQVIRPEAALTQAIQARQYLQLQALVTKAQGSLRDASVAIWIGKGDSLTVRVAAGIPSSLVVDCTVDKADRDPVARAYNNRTVSKADHMSADADFKLQSVAGQLRWKSAIAVPMLSRYGHVLGVLGAFTIEHFGFTNSEEALLVAVAESAAAQMDTERNISSLHALHDLGTRLTLALSREQVLRDVVTFAPRITGADICSIHLYNAARLEFEDVSLSAMYGADPHNVEKPRAAGGLTERVLHLGWVVCEDVHDERDFTYSTFVRNERIRSYIGISLEVANEPLGVLYLSYREPHSFTADELTLIRSLSHYAATAIYISQLFSQRDTFAAIAREITQARDRHELLRTVLERALTLLGSDRGSIGLIDPETGGVRLVSTLRTEEQTVPMGVGLVGSAIQSRQPVRVSDVRDDERYLFSLEDTRSELDVPLMRGDKAIGVLNIESLRVGAFSEEHEKLAVALAAQAVVALEKLDLTEKLQSELKQRVDDIELLQEAYGILNADALDESLQHVLARALSLTGAKYGAVYLIDRSAQAPELELVALPDRIATKAERQQPILVEEARGFVPEVARTGEMLCSSGDVRRDKRFWESYKDVRSELTVPLKFADRVYGVIDLESTVVDGFDERAQRLVKALAGAAAGVVRQVQLFEDLEAVNRLSQKLNSGVHEKEKEIFELIYNEATQLMDTNNMYIALYDELSDTVRFPLVYVKSERIKTEKDERYWPRSAGKGKTEWIIRNKTPLFHPTGAESAAWYKKEPDRQDYSGDEAQQSGSWVGVPMMADDAVLGVVATYHPSQDYVYSRDDLSSLQAMASQAAIAINNVRLNQQRKLREISQVLAANIYLAKDELLDMVYRQIGDFMRTDEMYIALYNEATDFIQFPLAYKLDKEGASKRIAIPPRPFATDQGYGRTEWILHHKKPLFHPTAEIGRAWYAEPGHAEFLDEVSGSWIGVPMVTDAGRALGVIAVYNSNRDYVYFGHDLELLQALAGAAANALETSRRFWQVQEASKGLGTLGTAMGAIQHSINNTLNIVSPNVTRLRTRLNQKNEAVAAVLDLDEIQQILDIIERNVAQTSRIIHQIQDSLRGERKLINLNSIIYEVVHKAGDTWALSNPAFELVIIDEHLDDRIPTFEGPIGQITEVFTNLVHNACRAMAQDGDANGKLEVASQLDESRIRVWVRDTGPGIPDDVRARLFQQPVATRDTAGTSGLGLYLAELIVRSQGGTIMVEHTGADGTSMLVTLPVPA